LITGLCLSLGACSGGTDNDARANDLAIRACSAQTVQPRAGFNPQTASISELLKLADTAMRRSELADQAAALSERWLLLSEVSAAIAVFAQQLIEVREQGAISLSMWDDYKTASSTYLAECQSALNNVPGSSLEMDGAVTALMALKNS
jgi:hypothetical protein